MFKILLKYSFVVLLLFIAVPNSYASKQNYEDFDLENIEVEDTLAVKINKTLEAKQKKKQTRKNTKKQIETTVEYRAVDSLRWEKFNKKRDYLEKSKETVESKVSPFDFPKFNLEGLEFIGLVIKYLVYALVFIGLAFLIFKLFEANFKADKIDAKRKAFFLEKLEENIHEVDLEKLLAEFTLQNKFSMMIRIQYLMIIKELSTRKIIDWKKQKTNGAYLQELYGHTLFTPFQKATRVYERIWFGEVQLDNAKYSENESNFKQLLAQIKSINIE